MKKEGGMVKSSDGLRVRKLKDYRDGERTTVVKHLVFELLPSCRLHLFDSHLQLQGKSASWIHSLCFIDHDPGEFWHRFGALDLAVHKD
jgi:hypothetical protein